MTLYAEETRRVVRDCDWPYKMRVDVVEYEQHLGLRFYRDNFETFDGVDKFRAAAIAQTIIPKIRASGVPIYLEVESGDGRNGLVD